MPQPRGFDLPLSLPRRLIGDLMHFVNQVPTVTIDVCWDVSHADLVGKNGKSAVKPTRANRGWTRYTVANYHWNANPSGGWRIASSQDLKQTPCAAS